MYNRFGSLFCGMPLGALESRCVGNEAREPGKSDAEAGLFRTRSDTLRGSSRIFCAVADNYKPSESLSELSSESLSESCCCCPQVRAGGRVTFRGFSSVWAGGGAWPAGAQGYYEVEVLDMGLNTQVRIRSLPPCSTTSVWPHLFLDLRAGPSTLVMWSLGNCYGGPFWITWSVDCCAVCWVRRRA
jgi:hypothetical protein